MIDIEVEESKTDPIYAGGYADGLFQGEHKYMEVFEAAKRWRRAFHHGSREEEDIAEQCLLQELEKAENASG